MFAQPPGWGPWNRRQWAHGVAAHIAGLPLGAVGIGLVWHVLGGLIYRPPLWVLGVLALGLALPAARLVPVHLEGSSWRVPQAWGRLGHAGFSGVFGACLGTGLATALASPGLYLLVAWGVAAPAWSAVWPAFLAFGLGRVIPFTVIAVLADRRTTDPAEPMIEVEEITERLAPAEAALLTLLAAAFLLS